MDWIEPSDMTETFTALSDYGADARLVAGGTWVTLVLRQGFLFPSALVSLRGVSGLDGIAYNPNHGLTLGAMATHRTVETHAVVKRYYPMLAETFGSVANVRIRNQATVGGCLCDADYASDPPAMLIALDADVKLRNQTDERTVQLADFITGHYETVIEPDEILTEAHVPPLPTNGRGFYLKYRSRSHEDRPCVGVAVVLADENGATSHLRVVVGAVAERPQRIMDAESLGLGKPMSEDIARQIAEAYADSIDPLDDLRGSSWYRSQMIRVLARRAIMQAYQTEAAR